MAVHDDPAGAMRVIKHDFGKKGRQTVRRFRQLLSLNALHKANPLPYLERASETIYQLESALVDAAEAAKPRFGNHTPPELIEVDRAEYRRLLDCRDIVEEALARVRALKELEN
jgi:hypothetical protein